MIFSLTNLRKSVSIFNPLKRSPNPTNARSSLVLGNVGDRGIAAVLVEEEADAVPEVIKFVLKFGLYPGAASGKGFNRGALPGADKKAVNAVVCWGVKDVKGAFS